MKKINQFGAEYRSARELQPLLGYSQWRRFEDAIKRAITSCKQSGNEPKHHFAGVGQTDPWESIVWESIVAGLKMSN